MDIRHANNRVQAWRTGGFSPDVAQPAGAETPASLNNTQLQLENGEYELSTAQEYTAENVVAVIAQPWVLDSAGQTVPAYLTVAEDTVTINIWEPETEEPNEVIDPPYLVVTEVVSSGMASISSSQYCTAQAHRPYARWATRYIGGALYKGLFYGAAMYCSGAQSMKIDVEMERLRSFLFVDHWDTVQGYQNQKSGEGGLGIRYGGEECQAPHDDYHDFRTEIHGQAISTIGPSCWNASTGNCQWGAHDTSITSTYRCNNG